MIQGVIVNQSSTPISKVVTYRLNLKDAITATPIIGSAVIGDDTFF